MKFMRKNISSRCLGLIAFVGIIMMLSACENSVTFPESQIKGPELKPMVKPEPSQISKVNDLTIFKDIILGAQDNEDYGGLINLENGYVYDLENADDVQSDIDFATVNGSSSGMNMITPSSWRFHAWSGDRVRRIYNRWYIQNEGTLIRLPDPDVDELQTYQDIQSVADIEAAFDDYSDNVQYRDGYSLANDGPKNNVRQIDEGDIILFKSKDRKTIAIMMVTAAVLDNTGYLQVEIKSGNY